MSPSGISTSALLLATALHAGFQLTVTLLVYPALVRTPAAAWAATHGRHSRAITPVVAVLYGGLLAATVAALWVTPRAPAVWVAGAATLAVFAVTGLRAAPLHGRLAAGPSPELLAGLVRADRVRAVLALLALAAALVATVSTAGLR